MWQAHEGHEQVTFDEDYAPPVRSFSDVTKPQTAKILAHLQTGATLTPLEALALGFGMRLGGRVLELLQAGYRIETERVPAPSGNMIARYRLQK